MFTPCFTSGIHRIMVTLTTACCLALGSLHNRVDRHDGSEREYRIRRAKDPGEILRIIVLSN